LHAFRQDEGTRASMVIVTSGLAMEVVQALVVDSRATHVCIVGSVDEIPSCAPESNGRVALDDEDETCATPPYIGRIGSSVGDRLAPISLDERRSNVRHQIDRIIAHDRALPVGRWTGRRIIGIAGDETRCDMPLLTGCRVMTHVLVTMLDTVDPDTNVWVSDGTKTWLGLDATESQIVPSPLPSSECVFVIGYVEAGRIHVQTTSGPTPVLTTETAWDEACHPVVFAFVFGREATAFADAVLHRKGGPCALCIFEATHPTDHIQAIYTMWGLILSLRDATDARLGEIVYNAVARTQVQMDVDCINWSIRGDPCTRLARTSDVKAFGP
jgi:hypothetical protein